MARKSLKYSLIVDQLIRDIEAGTYQIGSILPTEAQLMSAYGVSRHTVRSALGILRDQGIVASRQGMGTKVMSSSQQTTLVERIQSIDELIAYGQMTSRSLLGWKTVVADADLAKLFECKQGRRLLEVQMLRHNADQSSPPVAYLTLWMDALYQPVLEDLAPGKLSVAELLEHRFGVGVGAVQQIISATLYDEQSAVLLGGMVGAPALKIERRYRETSDAQPHLIACSICNAENIQVESCFVRSNKS